LPILKKSSWRMARLLRTAAEAECVMARLSRSKHKLIVDSRHGAPESLLIALPVTSNHVRNLPASVSNGVARLSGS
jgi:hypothetical protein